VWCAIDAVLEEIAERLRRGGKATRHTHAGTSQLADHFTE